jgi:hypothetical protein
VSQHENSSGYVLDCPTCDLTGGPFGTADEAGQHAGRHDDLMHRGKPTMLIRPAGHTGAGEAAVHLWLEEVDDAAAWTVRVEVHDRVSGPVYLTADNTSPLDVEAAWVWAAERAGVAAADWTPAPAADSYHQSRLAFRAALPTQVAIPGGES